MNAQEVVNSIAQGMREAHKLSEAFLGAEQIDYEVPIIRPEYLATVKIAEQLTDPSMCVALEAPMKDVRSKLCSGLRIMKNNPAKGWFKNIGERFRFGKKDGERLDVLVSPSVPFEHPMLLIEIKLSVRNISGLKKDVERILKIMLMYNELDLLKKQKIYAAVVFHELVEGIGIVAFNNVLKKHIQKLDKFCDSKSKEHKWLRYKVGPLTRGTVVEPIKGQEIVYAEGQAELEFCRDKYIFSPGLILLGNAPDIETVQF